MSALTTVGGWLAAATHRLAAAGVATPRVDAEILARHVLGWSAAQLALRAGEALAPAVAAHLAGLARRREAREPLQLIVGSVGFRYLDLDVRPGVFIPRPETEVLAGLAIDAVSPGSVVVEPCTGTGAIACAVSAESQAGTVFATDADPAAAALATHNARRCAVAVTVVQGDLLASVPECLRGRVEVLVSNPPYLATADLDDAEPEVVEWDPIAALVAGPTGHEFTDRLIAAGVEWLQAGGWLLLEVDVRRAHETVGRCHAAGYRDAAALPDLADRVRFVRARRPG